MNEIAGVAKNSGTPVALSYAAAGQMTQNDRYRYVYDGFGRLVALKDTCGNPIATYGHNGLGFRIWEQPNGGDKRFFCYDERWRIVATFDDTNATPTRRVIHHAAGVGGAAGMSGSSYIDSVILSPPPQCQRRHRRRGPGDAVLPAPELARRCGLRGQAQ